MIQYSMIPVQQMYIAPVKSLALTPIARARLDKPGIAGDRAFFIVDERGKLITQRDHGALWSRSPPPTTPRFRQNIYVSGVAPHGEDRWIGRQVRVGTALVRVKMPDSRCVVTTHSPETGEPDLSTLKIISGYRTDQPKEANFGVYCTVVEPGEAAVGHEVAPPD